MTTQQLTTPPILSVTALTQSIKRCLEGTFPLLYVQGEVSNCKLHTSGHLYLSIKDANSQIAAVMYRADVQQLAQLPKDGMEVIVTAEMNVYPPSGRYQLIIKNLKPAGKGALLLQLEELKQKLLKKGWFRAEHKKPLPKLPLCIGVVTSPTGAAIQDILHVLKRRFAGFKLLLNPVKVQGEGAAREIAEAIQTFNRYQLVDVIIVGRGGGSIEDLWAFNEEIVAEAIFASVIPIISAVGHETDHCIADYVADVRAPTPSAAAEIVIAEKEQQIMHLHQIERRLHQTMLHSIKHGQLQLEGIRRLPVWKSSQRFFGPWVQKMDFIKDDLAQAMHSFIGTKRLQLKSLSRQLSTQNPLQRLIHSRERLDAMAKHLNSSWLSHHQLRKHRFESAYSLTTLDSLVLNLLNRRQEKLQILQNSLNQINPKRLLSQGYAILFSEIDDSVITSVHTLEKKQQIRTVLADGSFISTVNKVVPNAN